MEKTIFVYENWTKEDPLLMGRLFSEVSRGKESFSFQYDDEWLRAHRNGFLIDPELEFYKGRQYPRRGTEDLFGVFLDSCPDRWGRMLIKRDEHQRAERQGKTARTLMESDYLLRLSDESRMGALRFKLDPDGVFLDDSFYKNAIPPMGRIRELETASFDLSSGENKRIDRNLAMLLAPGSSLGGARPKANVRDESGELWIAKFPSYTDEINKEAWEMTALQLAGECGLVTAPTELLTLSDKGSTLLIKRFDREEKRRIHFASAMTMLDRRDRESGPGSYTDIADFVRMYGKSPKEDLAELWRRIVFSILISNTDDHLRNHGFIIKDGGWRLSPVYDINPEPDTTGYLSLAIDGDDSAMDLRLAIESAEYYGLNRPDAEEEVSRMALIVRKKWSMFAKSNGIQNAEIEYMNSAFAQAERWNSR